MKIDAEKCIASPDSRRCRSRRGSIKTASPLGCRWRPIPIVKKDSWMSPPGAKRFWRLVPTPEEYSGAEKQWTPAPAPDSDPGFAGVTAFYEAVTF
jgi:hypothetical protein